MNEAIDLPRSMIKTIHEIGTQISDTFPSADPWLNREEAAEVIGVSESTLRYWRRMNVFKGDRHGARIYYQKSICETIRDLRKEHGELWPRYMPESESLGETKESMETDISAKLIRRGLDLFHAGRSAEAAAVLAVTIEELNLVNEIEDSKET